MYFLRLGYFEIRATDVERLYKHCGVTLGKLCDTRVINVMRSASEVCGTLLCWRGYSLKDREPRPLAARRPGHDMMILRDES